MIDESNAAMWWAGKEFIRGKKLMDFVGKNEKTKIIAKIQKVTNHHILVALNPSRAHIMSLQLSVHS